MLRYLLDTNICIHVLKHKPESARQQFNRHAAYLATSAVVMAELRYGAEKSARPDENREAVEALAGRLTVLPFDDTAADHHGRIRAELERAGQPIGAYDLMIAAQVRSLGLTLVTNNTREFERVSGLLLEDWI
jgi:tRNA(fMet)-specific endonuclease VapC